MTSTIGNRVGGLLLTNVVAVILIGFTPVSTRLLTTSMAVSMNDALFSRVLQPNQPSQRP
jgi:hypothetical protein